MTRCRLDTPFWDGFFAGVERGIGLVAGLGAAYLVVRIGLGLLR